MLARAECADSVKVPLATLDTVLHSVTELFMQSKVTQEQGINSAILELLKGIKGELAETREEVEYIKVIGWDSVGEGGLGGRMSSVKVDVSSEYHQAKWIYHQNVIRQSGGGLAEREQSFLRQSRVESVPAAPQPPRNSAAWMMVGVPVQIGGWGWK